MSRLSDEILTVMKEQDEKKGRVKDQKVVALDDFRDDEAEANVEEMLRDILLDYTVDVEIDDENDVEIEEIEKDFEGGEDGWHSMALEGLLDESSDSEEEDLQELITPLFQMYVSVIEMLTVFSQMVLPLFSEDIKSYLKSVSRLDTKYKVGKDESPVMDSYFGCWKLFDARIGKRKETLAQVALELSDSFHEDPNVLDLIQKMCDSYMGIYVHEGFEGDMVLLRDVITDVVKPSFNPSVYRGEKGELWFTRLLPHPEDNEYVSITTPYIIEATEDEWLEFFATKGVVKGHLNAEEKYIELMKRGKTRNYWTNYVVEEYVDDLDQAILLGGVPKK
jgi:hypothetical protein